MLSSVFELWDYTSTWSSTKGIFTFELISLLMSQSLHDLSFVVCVLHQKNVQILISIFFTLTMFTCFELYSVSEFWDLLLLWSFFTGKFKCYFLLLLLPQSSHAVLSPVFEFWDYTLSYDPSSKEHLNSYVFHYCHYKVYMLWV